jgi:hypothetical protein
MFFMGIAENPKVLAERMRTLAEEAPVGHWTNSKDGELLFEVTEFMENFNRVRHDDPVDYIPSSAILSFGS